MIQGVIMAQGPASAAYVAGAVQFDGSTTLGRATAFDGVAADAPGFLLSVWVDVAAAADIALSPTIAYQHQGAGAPSWLVGLTPDGTTGHVFASFRSTDAGGMLEFGVAGDADSWTAFGAWAHLALAVQTDLAAGLKVRQLLVDGVLQAVSGYDGDAAFDIGWAAPTTDAIVVGTVVSNAAMVASDRITVEAAPAAADEPRAMDGVA